MVRTSKVVRFLRVGGLLTGLAVLVVSVLTSVLTAQQERQTHQDQNLATDVHQQAVELASYFERARTVTLQLANNPAFADFYLAPGTDMEKLTAGGPLIDRINAALAYLEQLYPRSIAEACFIDSSGAELASVVGGIIGPNAELSTDESGAEYFAPTRALPIGQVYQTTPYESPDTHQWVISNSTVVRAANGRSGLIHFEVALDSLRTQAPVTSGHTYAIVDAHTGAILMDSRSPHPDSAVLGRPGDDSLRPLLRQTAPEGVLTIGDRRLAYRQVRGMPGNANQWYAAVSAPRVDAGWTHGLAVWSLALMVAALLTIAAAVLSLRGYQRNLRRLALHDPLTGLPNRALLTNRLARALHAGERDGARTAVMVIDLDRFKEVNDTLGHQCGDELLRQVAQRLRATVRDVDTVARLGGDEFAVLMPGVPDQEAAENAARRLVAVLHDSFHLDRLTLDVEASVGVAVAPDHGRVADLLLRHADAAMYVAKDQHAGSVVYTDQPDHAPTRLALLGDLRRALDADDQLVLYYQPKVDLALGELVGVEALIRWQHPGRGMLPPSEFIPVAESTALIQRLTHHVLELALTQARAWLSAGLRVPIAVNLSTRCLLDLAFPSRVFDALARHEVPAAMLHLEITESTVMADPERALTVLRALHAGGIRLSIDDFGTGYSSMSYLKQLPVDELKVDRSFVRDMGRNRDDAVLVRSAIDLGHNLGLAVVAEGVEDDGVLSALRALGCDIGQGYHMARPMPAELFQAWLGSYSHQVPSWSARRNDHE